MTAAPTKIERTSRLEAQPELLEFCESNNRRGFVKTLGWFYVVETIHRADGSRSQIVTKLTGFDAEEARAADDERRPQ